jgi:hypothetical protein
MQRLPAAGAGRAGARLVPSTCVLGQSGNIMVCNRPPAPLMSSAARCLPVALCAELNEAAVKLSVSARWPCRYPGWAAFSGALLAANGALGVLSGTQRSRDPEGSLWLVSVVRAPPPASRLPTCAQHGRPALRSATQALGSPPRHPPLSLRTDRGCGPRCMPLSRSPALHRRSCRLFGQCLRLRKPVHNGPSQAAKQLFRPAATPVAERCGLVPSRDGRGCGAVCGSQLCGGRAGGLPGRLRPVPRVRSASVRSPRPHKAWLLLCKPSLVAG